MTSRQILVMNENTLGFFTQQSQPYFQILAGDLLNGGHDWKNGVTCAMIGFDHLRPAVQADFDRFRVCSKGYL